MAASLTPRETEILVAYVKESKSDVDWSKVAAAANCTTAKYARDKFALIRNKIIAASGGNAGSNTDDGTDAGTLNAKGTAKGTPGTKGKANGAPRKRKNDGDGDDEEAEKPAKKHRGKANEAKSQTPDGEESATDSVVKQEDAEENPNEAGEMLDALNG